MNRFRDGLMDTRVVGLKDEIICGELELEDWMVKRDIIFLPPRLDSSRSSFPSPSSLRIS